MAPRLRGCARAVSSRRTVRKSPLSLACFVVSVVGVVGAIALAASGVAFASAQATTTAATGGHHASPAPPPPFDPSAGWPSSGMRTLDVTLPPAETVEDEEYLCTSVPLPDGIPLGLTRVEPLASAAVVHHILLFGRVSFMRRSGPRRKRREH